MRYIQSFGTDAQLATPSKRSSAVDDLHVGITVSMLFAVGIVILIRQVLPHDWKPRLRKEDRMLDPRERIQLGKLNGVDYPPVEYPRLPSEQSIRANGVALRSG